MAAGSKQDGQNYEVRDEGDVDTKIKERIIDARNRVDDTEEYLYVKAPVEQELQANSAQQDVYYGMMVKQFLRTIEPILRSTHLENSTQYYKNVALGSVELVPRNTDSVPFEDCLRAGIPSVEFRTRYDLAAHAELPQAVEVGFAGLKSVIETNGVVSEAWTVPAADGSVIRTTDEQAVPKEIYETALREADEFLQKSGVGIDLGPGEVESRPDPI